MFLNKKIERIIPILFALFVLLLPNLSLAQNSDEVAQNEPINLSSSDFPPYYGADLKNNGFIAEIIQVAFDRSGYSVNFDFMNFDEALSEAELGIYDGIFTLWYRQDREEFFAYSDALPSNDIVLCKISEEDISYEEYVDLRQYTIGVVKNYTYPQDFLDAGLNLKEYDNDGEILESLYNNEIDLGIIDKAQAIYITKKDYPDFFDILSFLDNSITTNQQYVGFSKAVDGYQDKLLDFNSGLKQIISDGTYDSILEKHGYEEFSIHTKERIVHVTEIVTSTAGLKEGDNIQGTELDAGIQDTTKVYIIVIAIFLFLLIAVWVFTMERKDTDNDFVKPVRKQLMIPLGIIVFLVAVTFSVAPIIARKQRIEEDDKEKFALVLSALNNSIIEEENALTAIQDSILNSPDLREILKNQDRQLLFDNYEDLFITLKEDYDITHFYFHLPNRENLLRVHNPDRYGDITNRFTLKESEQIKDISGGIELGPLGTFTLRVVRPIFDDDVLIGYLELGKEIEKSLEKIEQRYDVELIVVIKKEFLSQDKWENGMQMLGRDHDWDRFSDNALIYSSLTELPVEMDYFVGDKNHTHGDEAEDIIFNAKKWRIMTEPLIDVSGKDVGDLIILNDVTLMGALFTHFIYLILVIAFVVFSIIISFVYVILGKTDKGIQRQQLALKESEEYYKTLIENSSDVIAILDAEGVVFYESPSHKRVLGYNEGELVGKNIFEFIHPKDQNRTYTQFIKFLKKPGKVDKVNFRFLHKNTSWIDIEGTAKNLLDDPKIKGIVINYRNITNRKKAEKAIVEAKEKIEAVINGIGDAVFVVDTDLRITLFNPIASQLSGYTEKEVMGKKYSDILKFVFEDDKDKINDKFLKDALRTGEVQAMSNHTMLINRNGDGTPVADSAAPLKDEKGNITGCVVVFRDVTKEKEVDKMKSEFISIASHQLRTPLSAIKWFMEMLIAGDLGKVKKDQLEFIKKTHVSAQRMSELVNDLLNISRIESGKVGISPEPTDMVEMANSIIDEIGPVFIKREQKILFKKPKTKLKSLRIDPKLIRQVIVNLLSNASKYTPEKGKIILKYEIKKPNFLITVKDNGYGIPKKEQARIFSKFFRADNIAGKDTEGTGLGLYVVKQITEASGGKTWFESEEDKGTEFYISLPLAGSTAKKGEKTLA